MPQAGIDSVTVPGAVDGWAKAHARFGRLPWKDLFTPAIYYAEHGYPVPEIIHDFWEGDAQALKQTAGGGASFSARRKGSGGRPDVCQSGPGQDSATDRGAGPGRFLSWRNCAVHREHIHRLWAEPCSPTTWPTFPPEWVEPISTTYRGWKVYELPPNGQGMAALEMLNIMSTLAAGQIRSAGADGTA